MTIDVLHVLPDLAAGGAERSAVDLACGTRSAGFAAAVACIGRPRGSVLEAQLGRRGVPLRFLGKGRHFRPWYAPRLLQLIDELRPRLLHTHRHVMPYVLPALLLRRLPCVHTVQNMADREVGAITGALHHAAFRLGVVPVAVSQAVRASVRARYGVAEVALIPNAIDAPAEPVDAGQRKHLRTALGYGPDDVIFICVGRLSPQKDPAALLAAFASGPGPDPRAHLLFVGDGPLRGALERLVARRHLGSRVRFLGQRADVPDLLAAADVFALASRWEGLPLAVMEAMAAGLPVVATAVGGVPEIVQHECTALLAEPGDETELASELHRLLVDAGLRRRLGRAARERAQRRTDCAAMARAYATLYEHVLAEGPHWAASRA